MEIIEKEENGVRVFKLAGRLDSNTSSGFEDRIGDALRQEFNKIIMDFGALDYISSAGLRVILKATKDMKRLDGQIVLCALQDYVREVFEISGFDTLLPIVPTMDDAFKKFD
jgi:anti-sigma B factor antagonist